MTFFSLPPLTPPPPNPTPVYTCERPALSPAQVERMSLAQEEKEEPKLLGAVAKPPSFSGPFTLVADFLAT